MPRAFRILILLVILFVVGVMTLAEKYWVRTWTHPLHVAVYPIALDAESRDYVVGLTAEEFRDVGEFILRESQHWGIKDVLAPRIDLKAPIHDMPPLGHSTSKWEAIKLSLRLRWFAFRHTPFWQGLGTVRLFLLYHHAAPGEVLPHSLGLQKGLLGVVHLFSDERQHAQNNVVMTHELLHALGATDKYDANGMPIHPWGYADPHAVPLLPQYQAEIMGGRVPISETQAVIPSSLAKTVVGAATAAEIGW
jgi:hypothetical protein